MVIKLSTQLVDVGMGGGKGAVHATFHRFIVKCFVAGLQSFQVSYVCDSASLYASYAM